MNHTQIESFIDGVVSLSAVDRFHGHQTVANQSVADHSCRVAMIAQAIALEYYKGDVDKANTATVAALFHDFSEGILKNDANSSVKDKYGIREALKQLETDVITTTFKSDAGDTNMTVIRNLMLERCNKTDYDILKVADSCDFGLYIWNEKMLGNKHVDKMFESFRTELARYPEKITKLPIVKALSMKILEQEPKQEELYPNLYIEDFEDRMR